MSDSHSGSGRMKQDDFKVWTAGEPKSPNYLGLDGVTVKLGQRVCKTVSLGKYGDPETKEVRKRVLKFSKFDRQEDGGFDFANPDITWFIEDEEIEALLAFLNEDVGQAGRRYRVIDATSPSAELLSLTDDDPKAVEDLIRAMSQRVDPEVFGAALAMTTEGLSSAEIAVIRQRRNFLAQASAAAEGGVNETVMQRLLERQAWVFGGRYTGVLERRQLLQLDEHDIPLIRADGSLHIVELKNPVVPALTRQHRNHWIVGNDVHEAVMQATNYVRTADELGAATERNLREELGIDVDLRRVFATVVIGHRRHVMAEGMPEEQFDVAMRTYNAVLNRVEVVTYDQLLEAAERSLTFEGP